MTWLIFIPLIAGVVLLVIPAGLIRLIAVLFALVVLSAALWLAYSIWQIGPIQQALGGWDPPLGIVLYADGLSALLIAMTGLTGALCSFYAVEYFAEEEQKLFWPLWFLLWGALNALFLSDDIFNIYVVLELATLAGVALIAMTKSKEALGASFRYLLAALLGSLLYLMGVGFLYAEYHMLDIRLLSEVISGNPASHIALALMTVGLLLKTALFPLHFWLPPAHSSAPAPVSAVLSALVVKGSFYVLLRLWFELFQHTVHFSAGQLIGALGAVAIIWGSYKAIRQEKLKLLIAHSTVGQIGYLFLLFPILAAEPSTSAAATWAWSGGIYQVLSHAFAKAAMFLSAGIVIYATGSDNVSAMRDMAGRLPLTTFAFALAGVSLIGLPPSGGFVAKWLLMKGVIGSEQWWWIPVVTLGSLLTAGYVFLLLRQSFLPRTVSTDLKPVSLGMQWCALGLSLGSIAIGVRAQELLQLLGRVGKYLPPEMLNGLSGGAE